MNSVIEATTRYLREIASKRETTTYTQLVSVLQPIVQLRGPNDRKLWPILAEVGRNEHRAGRGILTAVLVHMNGDQMPGAPGGASGGMAGVSGAERLG